MEIKNIKDIKLNPNNPRLYEVKWYEWLYYISEDGNVYSKNWKWNKGLNLLKKWIDWSWYEIVTLCKDKKRATKTVHRIIMTAIYWESELYVNHKNGIKHDNRIENIEWCTAKENIQHAIKNGLLKPNTDKIAKEKRKAVLQIDILWNIINRFESAHEASRITKFNRWNISTGCRLWCMFYNYYWKYA
jgi:hypothetical protein